MPIESTSRTSVSYRNGVLTVICGLLLLLCIRGLGQDAGSAAIAAPQSSGLPNAAEQRVRMIEELRELRTISTKLGSIETKLDTRLSAIEKRLNEQTIAMRNEKRRRGGNEENE